MGPNTLKIAARTLSLVGRVALLLGGPCNLCPRALPEITRTVLTRRLILRAAPQQDSGAGAFAQSAQETPRHSHSSGFAGVAVGAQQSVSVSVTQRTSEIFRVQVWLIARTL